MQQLITAYLYEHKNCPLPSLGSLQLEPGHATYVAGENRILAPVSVVTLSSKELPTNSLVDYIAVHKKITALEASAMLGIFCEHLKTLPLKGETVLPGSGTFHVDEDGQLQFISETLPSAYFPEVAAERVIHKDVAHHMLVGDTHTNTTAMTEKLQEEHPKRSRWWIAAIVLFVLGLIALIFFYSQRGAFTSGNGNKVSPKTESKTYSQPQ